MENNASKVLVIVEGAKTDVRLMRHLFDIYGISKNHEIVSYKTNIYTLYKEMFADGEPENMDILQVLKEREKDPDELRLLNESYSDILLIFDFDPHDTVFSPEKISEMLGYFTESSDMGKLYINYPMVEAFYHMKSIPDNDYYDRIVAMDSISEYKATVNKESCKGDPTKFAVSKDECSTVIRQNIIKGNIIAQNGSRYDVIPESGTILEKQLDFLKKENSVYVLCTCAYYIAEYNSEFIKV